MNHRRCTEMKALSQEAGATQSEEASIISDPQFSSFNVVEKGSNLFFFEVFFFDSKNVSETVAMGTRLTSS